MTSPSLYRAIETPMQAMSIEDWSIEGCMCQTAAIMRFQSADDDRGFCRTNND